MRLPLLGGCLCGSVRYEVHAAPRNTFYCHCRDCQKETGGPYAMEIYIAGEALKIIGPRVSFAVIGDSGKQVRRIRCAHCGSPLVTEFDVALGFVCIKVCSLDDASHVRPDFHVYVRSKQPWDRIEDGLPQFSADF